MLTGRDVEFHYNCTCNVKIVESKEDLMTTSGRSGSVHKR